MTYSSRLPRNGHEVPYGRGVRKAACGAIMAAKPGPGEQAAAPEIKAFKADNERKDAEIKAL